MPQADIAEAASRDHLLSTTKKHDKDKDKDQKNEGDPLFKGMKYRSIGPYRGGRSLTASGIPGDPTTYYFGSTGGGVWKSIDGANTWSPIFDKDGAPAIGSIAVSVSDPNIVYVGTGEACMRGNISHGDGVWKSVDAGKSWKNVGLKDSRAIGRVIVNPRNPDIVFVAALGHPYGPNTERGVFRTTDGGKTWDKVLYKDENTGAIDIAFDPQNPEYSFCLFVGSRDELHGPFPAEARAAAFIARPMAGRLGSIWKNTVCQKDHTGALELLSQRIQNACSPSLKRKKLAAFTARMTAAIPGTWSTAITRSSSDRGITCTSSLILRIRHGLRCRC